MRFFLVILLFASAAAHAAPVIIAVPRPAEPQLSTLWKDGPCRGQLRTKCQPALRAVVPPRTEVKP